jgi:hypothetical protein
MVDSRVCRGSLQAREHARPQARQYPAVKAEQEPDAHLFPVGSVSSEAVFGGDCGTELPTAEETAAIVAVLSLMQEEPPQAAESVRTSPWARAGRREAVRPWTKPE